MARDEDTSNGSEDEKPQRLSSRLLAAFRSRPVLLFAFALAIMADPISSVAYAIEAALGELGNNLRLLLPTMGLVVLVIGLIVVNYRQLVSRFPEGGGSAAATGQAFGEPWAFVPIGALIVDFALTVAISASSGASNIVAYLPTLAPFQVILALGLLLAVAGLTWFGHSARSLFGVMAIAFIAVSIVVLIGGAGADPAATATESGGSGGFALATILLAFPVAMALATGVEAPSTAIAQLGQLDNESRKRFGHLSLIATLIIVGTLTMGFAALALRHGIRLPLEESTLTAEIAKASVGGFLFAAFQAVIVLLLIAAGASALQAGPGMLKALARERTENDEVRGVLPGWLGQTNRYYTPYWSLLLYGVAAIALVLAAGADEQTLVLFYAVSVFMSFLAGLASMVVFSYREGNRGSLVLNTVGTLIVAFVLVMNLARVTPIASLGATLLIAFGLYGLWVKNERPRGIAGAEAEE
jgi:amino acid transporter